MSENQTTENKKGFFRAWMLIPIILVAIAIPTILGTVLKNTLSKAAGKVGTPVTVETAVKGSLTQQVEISGTIATEGEKTYYSPVSAVISKCDLKTGDTIKKGDMLVEYDIEDLQKQLEDAQLQQKASLIGSDIAIKSVNVSQQKAAEAAKNYEEAEAYVAHYNEVVGNLAFKLGEAKKVQADIATVKAEIEELTKTLKADPEDKKAAKKLTKKQEKLKELSKTYAEYDVETLTAAYEQNSADLAEYKALKEQYNATKEADPTAGLQKEQQAVNKEIAQKSTESIEEAIAEAEKGVSAEFTGVVTASAAAGGMAVSEGMQLFSVADTSKIKVVLQVGKNDLEKIQLNQKAIIKVGDREYSGYVSDIARIASTSASGTISVDVSVHIDNPDDSLIFGTEAKVTIDTAEKKDIILIPMVCLNYASDSTFCYVVRDKKLEKVTVTCGISNDELIEITSGINDGDEVVRNVTSDLTEGMDVNPIHESEDKKETSEEK
ncbi:MAG: efflux RND transporter periplasmic adaptor subunit [Lachnospiraceae bacterium]|nr:efflux RND transporter periplasmic adaptor subunit [Lachnospiraceae bacterium]